MRQKRTSIAGRLTRKSMLWLLAIVIGLSYFVFQLTGWATRTFYTESYYNKMCITMEYTRRVLSDVYVAVTNNIYYVEQNLDNPDFHKSVMERIVKNGTRVRSCGISFIEDYYPQKGHRFCPFAWRNVANPDVIWSENMGDADLDYLKADWFLDVIKGDSAQWSEPFYDGYDNETTLAAYMVPIHDSEGRTVAVLGADVSLDWLTKKLNEMDSIINENATFAANLLKLRSQSFIINHDGSFITHPNKASIMSDIFFNHVGDDASDLVERIRKGYEDHEKHDEKIHYDGRECYVFYTPVKYTEWTIVTVVPWQAIDMLGIINGFVLLLIIAACMMLIVLVCNYYLKRETRPLQNLIKATDDIAKGHFDTPMPDIKHNDEMRQLCDSFEKMQYAFTKYIDNLKSKL